MIKVSMCNGEIKEIKGLDKREFLNKLNNAKSNNQFMEYTENEKFIVLNPNDISSVEFDKEPPQEKMYANLNAITFDSPEEARRKQMLMQPDLKAYEEKKAFFEKQRAEENAKMNEAFSRIYKKPTILPPSEVNEAENPKDTETKSKRKVKNG